MLSFHSEIGEIELKKILRQLLDTHTTYLVLVVNILHTLQQRFNKVWVRNMKRCRKQERGESFLIHRYHTVQELSFMNSRKVVVKVPLTHDCQSASAPQSNSDLTINSLPEVVATMRGVQRY